jgi:hypothetical protein
MQTNEATPAKNQFQSYKATCTSLQGVQYPCLVVNRRENVTFNDGTVGTALKIREITYATAGNAYSQKFVERYAAPMLVKAHRVVAA